MKRIFLIVLVATMFVASGCGGSKKAAAAAEKERREREQRERLDSDQRQFRNVFDEEMR